MIQFHSNPNYWNVGPWDDSVIIKCPNRGLDCRFGKLSHVPYRNCPISENKINSLQMSYVEDKFGKYHVPARIMSLYRDPRTGENMSIVHACCPWMEINSNRSSVITKSWHLQHYLHHNRWIPHCNHVKTSKFVDSVRVFMESHAVFEEWDDEESSGHVVLATRRSEHWADKFLLHS